MSDTRTPDEIERDIERERAELAGTIGTLQDRFSVDGMFQQVSEHFKDNGGEIARNISATVKQNPLGVALVGAGLAWLAFGSGPSVNSSKDQRHSDLYRMPPKQPKGRNHELDREDDDAQERWDTADGSERYGAYRGMPQRTEPGYYAYRDDDPELDWFHEDLDDEDRGFADRARDRMHDAGNAVGNAAHGAAGGARSAGSSVAAGAGSAADAVKGAASSAGDNMRSAAAGVRDTASDAADSVQNAAARMRERLAHGTETLSEEARDRVIRARAAAVKARDRGASYARSAAEHSSEAYDRQPLAFGALAFAIGAAAAATLPGTRREDEVMGEQSDRLMRRAQRILEEERRRATEVAGAVRDEATKIASETRRDIDDRAPGDKTAVEAAIDKAEESVERIADKTKDEAEKRNLGRATQE